MSKEDGSELKPEHVDVNDHSSPDEEKIDQSLAAKDSSAASLSHEQHVQEREDEPEADEETEVQPTGIDEKTPGDDVKEEMSSVPARANEADDRSNGESEEGENLVEKYENKETEERKYETVAPGSPSQAGLYAGYGGHGYMPVYGHAMYSQYGYSHYPQPPYYPGGYHPHYPMPPPHMMPPQYVEKTSEQTGSPGRRYHNMPPYYPYPPGSPVLSPTSGGQPHYPTYIPAHESFPLNEGGQKEGPEGGFISDNTSPAASRMKIYVKQSGQASEEVVARRSRKNTQSRARAAKHREYVAMIEAKDPSERTPEEQQVFETHQMRRKRKNDRSRERALEKKHEVDKVLAKPETDRTKIERQFLEAATGAKKRKNEGDRLRRRRLKELGFGSTGLGKPGVSARGPLPSKYGAESSHHVVGYGMPPPHSYVPMIPPPPPPHEHAVDAPHSPGDGVY